MGNSPKNESKQFFEALKFKNTSIFASMINKKGFDVDMVDENGCTLIQSAIIGSRNLEIISILAKKKANLNVIDKVTKFIFSLFLKIQI